MKAAQELGRKRWEGKSDEEKSAHMGMMGEKAAARLTPEERKARAAEAAKARWAKKNSGKSGAKKARKRPP